MIPPQQAENAYASRPHLVNKRKGGIVLYRRLSRVHACAFVTLTSVSCLLAQGYPDTLWVPVTFYDFRSDLSNPEFQADHAGQRRYNMVAATLDADGKPTVGSQPYINYYIKYWYRDWATSAAGDKTIPVYTCLNNCTPDGMGSNAQIQYDGTTTVDYDTAFKNVVIHDSLPFVHIGNGEYEFSRTGNNEPQFFWIDGRGFGNEGKSNNYSFTMELHSTFTYETGLTFDFNGDDDVWVFINGKLAMDLGGIHSPASDSFDVDDIAQSHGLEIGKDYTFDLFYAERHTTQSTIKITTNILAPPKRLRLYPTASPANNAYPSSMDWKAGDQIPMYAHVLDSAGTWKPEYDKLVEWEIVDTMHNPGLSSDTAGSFNFFLPTEAYGTVTIRATFTDPDYGDVTQVELRLNILPGDPDHVDIQTGSQVSSLRNDVPFDSLFLDEEETQANLYAVVRDKYGNYVRNAGNATWQSRDDWVVEVTGASEKWHATVDKIGEGQTRVVAGESGLKPDSTKVRAILPGTGLAEAITRDGDGDGYLDTIELHFDSLLTLPAGFDINDMIITYEGHTFTVVGMRGRSGPTDSVFIVAIEEWHSDELQTGWTLTLEGKIPNVKPWRDFPSSDGAGPVVAEAVHYPGWTNDGDTIRIMFSEPVMCNVLTSTDPEQSFRYFRADTAKQAILNDAEYLVQCGADEYVTLATIVTAPGTALYPYLDSLQLTAGARDRAGNSPPRADIARKVVLQSGGENRVEAAITPNPFVPGQTTLRGSLPATTQSFYQNVIGDKTYGTLVGITTKKPLRARSDGSYATADIYDAVGNLVIDGLQVKQAADYRDYGVVWDGRNRSGRLVGGGGYLIVVRGTDADDAPVEKKMKIGVKR